MIWNPNFGYSEIWFLIVAVFAKWSWELCKEKLLRVLRFLRQHKTFYNVWNAASARSIISHPAEPSFLPLAWRGLERSGCKNPSPFSIARTELKVGEAGSKRSFVLSGVCQLQNEPTSRHRPFKPQLWPNIRQKFLKTKPSFSLLLTTLDWIPELFKDKHLHGLELWHGDWAVGEDDKVEERHGARVVQLGGKQQAGWGQQLQLGPGTRGYVKRLVFGRYWNILSIQTESWC